MNRALPLIFLCIAALLAAFFRLSGDLWEAWQTDEYSHGILIPFLAALLGAHALSAKKPAPAASWLGLPLLLLGFAGLMVGALAAFQAAAHYGFLLALGAVSLAFVGVSATRTLLPALFYLWFAIPLPHLFQASLSQDLQLISSTIGVKILELLSIPVFQDGNIIDLGAYRLQVVDACSGLRYLFPLISFGYLAACLLEAERWKKLLVLFSTIPITIFMNSLRIAVIGITVGIWGQEAAEGLVHELEGWVVFALCAALLLLEIHFLHRIGKPSRFRMDYFSLPEGALLAAPLRITAPALTVTALCLLAGIWFGSGLGFERRETLPPHPNLSAMPRTLANWHATPTDLPPDVLQSLQLTDYWLADYTAPDELPVNGYIAYYERQRIGSATHSPSQCIPAGGWQIKDSRVVTVPLEGGHIQATRLLIQKGNIQQLAYFWFSERGRNLTQTTYAKWYLLIDSMRLGRTDGALIRVVTQLAPTEDEASADARLTGFIRHFQPAAASLLPGETPNP